MLVYILYAVEGESAMVLGVYASAADASAARDIYDSAEHRAWLRYDIEVRLLGAAAELV